MKHSITHYFFCALVILSAGCTASRNANSNYFADFPAGTSPREVGNQVAKRFLEVPHPNFGRPEPPVRISYPEVCAWYGALNVCKSNRQ